MAPGLHILVYYGPDRYKYLSTLEEYDIVLATYNVVAFEWKNHKRSPAEAHAHGLFSLTWHRIVLDEGASAFLYPS
jgi:SNF2 family DNA or RNA helicase